MPTSELLRFEGLTSPNSVNYPIHHYGGFNWNNFGVVDKGAYAGDQDGYIAVAHGRGVAFSGGSQKLSFNSDTDFTLKSGHFAAAWNVGMTVEFTAIKDGHTVGHKTVILDQVDTLITFNSTFAHIDKVVINSTGGTHGTGIGDGEEVAFDNLDVAFYGAIPTSAHTHDHAAIAEMLGTHDAAHDIALHAGVGDCFF